VSARRRASLKSSSSSAARCAESETVEKSVYLERHAALARDLVCNAPTDRKEIAAGMIDIWLSPAEHRYSSLLARLLDECAATNDLDDQHKNRLRYFASEPAN
jgi:hypothetical protein